GIDFAIIRIGYRGENGIIYRDANADYNIQQAQSAGILVGVYFFSTAATAAEAREEAAWTTEAIKGYKISYPVVYDCEGYTNESSRMYGISAAARTDNAIAFLSYVQNAGYTGMIYGAKADFENASYWDMSRIENDYKVWVAHYSQAVYPTKQTPDYNGRYDMWQYTNRGTVDGVEGNCDMVVSYFSADEAEAQDNSATPETATPPKTQEELLYTDINDQVTAKQEVNLREGAGTKYNVVATLKSGEFITRTGIGSNGWSRLIYNGKTVYAITSYLSNEVIEIETQDIVNGSIFTPANDQVTAKQEVNLRALPTTDSEIVGKLTSGTFLSRTAIGDKGWSRLDYNGQAVYAVTNYLTTEAPEINPEQRPEDNTTVTEHGMVFTLVTVNVTAKEEVNLRDKPTTDGSNIVYTLKNGEYITKTGVCEQSGWARLEYKGQTVYCIDSFLMQ
ncbi:MAG: SH3 domain-containing protein, partial [Clostridia bacterium]|nr:SH3 domain-containing protein [Clostridia bacterium]